MRALAFLLAAALALAPAAAAGPGELLVRLRDGGAAAKTWPPALAGAEISPLLPTPAPRTLAPAARAARARLERTCLVRLTAGADPAPLLAALAGLDSLVEMAGPNRVIPLAGMGAAPDPHRGEQWYLDRVGAERAWAVTRGRPDILIAFIDTGVLEHADLAPNLWVNDDPPGNASAADDATDQDGSGVVEDWEKADDDDNGYVDDTRGWDFVDAPRVGGPGDAVGRDNDVTDDSGHGTAVAGVIGAVADNAIGIAGLAPGCTLMPVRAGFNPGLGAFSGVLEEDDAAAAIVYAAENGARVINMSFGDTLLSPVVGDAVAYARELGAVLVAAAGNARHDGLHYPSGLEGVISAGASDLEDERASFSNFGPTLDLLAPGTSILTTVGTSDYLRLAGTSFSAPIVAAAAGLVLARDPALRASEAEAILLGSAADLFFPGFDHESGHGRLDAGRALGVTRAAHVRIHAPAAGAGVDRAAPVVVTAEGLRLLEYVVEVGAGRDPDGFTRLASGSGRQVVADTVAVWEADGLAPGEYTLRLRARDAVEGQLEERTLVTVDHTPPAIGGASVVPLWVEDRLLPFVFFSTDDLARGAIEITGPRPGGETRRLDEAFLTRDHVLRLPEDLAAGDYDLLLAAENAAGLAAGGPELAATVSGGRAHTYALAGAAPRFPAGELAPRPADLDGDGARDLVLMAEAPDSPFGPLVFFEATGDDAYVARDTLDTRLLVRDVGDSDGDGRMEILASGRGNAWLLESRAPGAYPDSVVWADTLATAGFAIGFAALGSGPAILAIKSDSLLVYRSTGDASRWSRSAFVNFGGNARSFAPSFFAGDVDGDGAVEVAIGDAGGNLLVFREAGGLAPAYSYRLPGAASPLVAGGDLDGDGRPEIVVDQPEDLDVASEALLERRRHLLLVLSARGNHVIAVEEALGVAGAESGTNALRVASVDADPEAEILLAAAPDLYVFDREGGASLVPTFYRGGVRSSSLAVGDGDGDGRVEVFARAGEEVVALEARDPGVPGPLPPDGLRARLLDGGGVTLEWNPGTALYRLYRAAGDSVDCAGAQLLAEVAEAAYLDTTAGDLARVTYRVSAVEAGVEGACSRPLTVARGAAPVVLAVEPEQARAVRIAFSTPMDGSADRLENYRLLDPAGASLALSSVIGAGSERARILVLRQGFAGPGRHRLHLGALRSAAGVPLAGAGEIGFEVPAGLRLLPPLVLEAAAATGGAGGEIELRLSAAPDSGLGADPASYRLVGGFRLIGAAVAGRAVRLALDPATPLRPGTVRVGLAPLLRGAAGEVVVPGDGDEVELVIGGSGIVAYPNPWHARRAVSDGVTFAGLVPGDRLVLLDALGREIWRVDVTNGGTAFLAVRGNPALASGVYLYRVEGPGGVRLGKLGIMR